MGCPAKKVCNKWAGSALMQDEAWPWPLPRPWCRPARRQSCAQDAHRLERAAPCGGAGTPAEDVGVQMLTVHGRTREQGYQGRAETTPSPL
jgi:tRNA-dihydrouridine synthase B